MEIHYAIELLGSTSEAVSEPEIRRQALKRKVGAQQLTRLTSHPEFFLAVPVLRSAVKSDELSIVRIRAAEALLLAGEPPDTLLELLAAFVESATSTDDRIAAIQALGYVGPTAAVTVPILLAALNADVDQIRSAALQALLLIRPSRDDIVRLVTTVAVQTTDIGPIVRFLTSYGRSIVPQLIAMLRIPEFSGRRIVIQSLEQIAWVPADAADAILGLIADPVYTRMWHRRGNPFLWFDSPVPVIRRAVLHAIVDVRRLTASVLTYHLKSFHNELVADLGLATQDSDENVRADSIFCLAQIANQDESQWGMVLPWIEAALRHDSGRTGSRILDVSYLFRPDDFQRLLHTIESNAANPQVQNRATEMLDTLRDDDGATVARLVEQLRVSPLPEREALDRLGKLGSKAVAAIPLLRERIESGGDGAYYVAYTIARIAPKHDVTSSLLTSDDGEYRFQTLAGLLKSSLTDTEVNDALRARIGDENNSVHQLAATELWRRTSDVELVVPALLRKLPGSYLYECKDRYLYGGWSLRSLRSEWHWAVNLLIEISAAHAAAVPLIATALDEAANQDLNFLRLQWELFHQAQPIVSEVVDWLEGTFQEETVAAAELLFLIGRDSLGALEEIRRLLRRGYSSSQTYAVEVLGRIGPSAKAAIGEIIVIFNRGTLGDVDESEGAYSEHRLLAAETLGEIIPELKPAVPIFRLIADNAYVRNSIALAVENETFEFTRDFLDSISRRFDQPGSFVQEEHPPEVIATRPCNVASLTPLLRSDNRETRRSTLLALGYLGSHAVSAIDDILNLLDDDRVDVRSAAILAIRQIQIISTTGWSRLAERLQSNDWTKRVEAADVIRHVNQMRDLRSEITTPERSIPSLLELLAGVDLEETSSRPATLARATYQGLFDLIRDLNEESTHSCLLVPLQIMIQAEDWILRDCAIYMLRQFGLAAHPLLPQVQQALKSNDWMVRLSAVCAIRKIASTPAELVASVRPSLNDENRVVYNEALDAIAEVDPDIRNHFAVREDATDIEDVNVPLKNPDQ